ELRLFGFDDDFIEIVGRNRVLKHALDKGEITMQRKMLILISVCLLIVVSACDSGKRPASVYLIPEGYQGWVQIAFGQKGAPEVTVKDSKEIFEIGDDGKLKISTVEPSYGIASDEFYYINTDGKRTQIDKNKSIHFQTIGSRGVDGEGERLYDTVVIEFFVGERDQVDKYTRPQIPLS
uniref:DUF6843 domain-containing protein n=1 Tax=Saccharibacillus qingshengii TaxID=1763540 RepID=UPI001C130D6C